MGIYRPRRSKASATNVESDAAIKYRQNRRNQCVQLSARDYYISLRTKYVASGWLEQPARRVYRRPRGQLSWQQVVISLQTILDHRLAVGGRTGLELQGYLYPSPNSRRPAASRIEIAYGTALALADFPVVCDKYLCRYKRFNLPRSKRAISLASRQVRCVHGARQ
ncbi:AbiEi antitoxin N-terminal domain-containing protein [Hoeflea olei]|uniref:AbiEi antitoxin N-terminal domain-containing protein n=1 Tax=Hoeflea olei TaxID=1480615 RepID=UPI00315B0C39